MEDRRLQLLLLHTFPGPTRTALESWLGAEARNWGEGKAVIPPHRKSSCVETVPAQSQYLGTVAYKVDPLLPSAIDVDPKS